MIKKKIQLRLIEIHTLSRNCLFVQLKKMQLRRFAIGRTPFTVVSLRPAYNFRDNFFNSQIFFTNSKKRY